MAGESRTSALRDLTERIRAVEARGVETELAAVRTGWDAVDATLPGGGLRRGATHEFVSVAMREATPAWSRREWEPPLAVLAFLAGAAERASGDGCAWSVWIGRRTWPYGLAAGGALTRMLCIDPPDAGARDWVVDAALRCSGLVVVADASGMDAAAARRAQLAAEAGGSVGLLARPWWEAKEVSFAASRWLVAPHMPTTERAGGGSVGGVGVVASRWVVTLDRCKGLQRDGSQSWQIERSTRGGVLTLASKMADGPRPAVAAS